MNRKMRIAVLSLGHPEFSAGGAETASYNLFKGYQETDDVEHAFYLARIDRGQRPTGGITWYRGNEFFWEQAMHDWTFLRGLAREPAATSMAEWLDYARPDIVHAHHYAHMGLETFRLIRNQLPNAKIFLTLHEYMAICLHNGQMIKRHNGNLCREASLEACGKCYPEHSRETLWMRKSFIQNHFEVIDGFIAPSEFLRQRYIAWGIAPEKITVIENAQVDHGLVEPRPIGEGEQRNRFGYFGQVNRYKGVDILLQAFEQATRSKEPLIYLEVHGANLEHQPADFRERVDRLRTKLERRGVLQWMGAYEPEDLPRRMSNVDWVVMPSIWWENSPMIIQEAFSCGRPVICSGIGGMAEKVRHGGDGFHVEPGNIIGWVRMLTNAGSTCAIWERARSSISPPPTTSTAVAAHMKAFAKL